MKIVLHIARLGLMLLFCTTTALPMQQSPWATIQESLERLLGSQDYNLLMPQLYNYLDHTPAYKTQALEWVSSKANLGDVPMMYLLLRNKHFALQASALSEIEWKNICVNMMIMHIRVLVDKYCCDVLGYKRTYHISIQDAYACAAQWKGGEISKTFTDKYMFWFARTHQRCGYPELCAAVTAWFQNKVFGSPVWVLYCQQKLYSKTCRIEFWTPDSEQRAGSMKVIESLQVHRARATEVILQQMNEAQSWQDFVGKAALKVE